MRGRSRGVTNKKKRLPRIMKADIRVTLPCPWVFDAADQGNGSC